MGSQANPLSGLEMSPLPIPSAEPVEMRPAKAPEPLPAQAGYAGKGGQSANIISNFLQGMAAGKAYKEEKMAKDAQREVMNAQMQYKFLQGVSSDPQQTPERRAEAQKLLQGAWSDMITAYQKYVTPEEDKSKKKGIGSRIKEGFSKTFKAQQPHLISEEQFEMLKKMGPMMAQPQGPTSQQKEEQLRLQELEKTTKRMDTARSEIDEANKMIEDGALRDPEKRMKVLDRITMAQNTMGNVTAKDLPDPQKEEYDRIATQNATLVERMKGDFAKDAQSAYEKQRRGEQLTDNEQRALDLFLPAGKPPDPLSIFIKMKNNGQTYKDPISGQERKIESDLDAYNAFINTEAAAAAKTKQYEFDMQQKPLKDAIRSKWKLQHGGQEPTKDELNSAWLDAVSTTGSSSKAAEKDFYPKADQKDAAQSSMSNVATLNKGEFAKFFRDRTPKDKDGRPKGASDFVVVSRSNFSGEEQKQWDKMAQALAHELQDRGFSLDQISTIVGREAVEGLMKMGPTPGGAKKFKVSGTDPSGKKHSPEDMQLAGSIEDVRKSLADQGWKDVTVEAE